MRFLLVIAFWAGVLCGVHAAPAPEAIQFFEAGDYDRVLSVADRLGGAENYALAARSLNARAYLEMDDSDARKVADRALEYAEAAIGADPEFVEGRLQAAIALAQRGARMAPWRAFFLNLADRARDALDLALALEPENAWALSSSAAWHLEVSRRGGEGRFGSDPEFGHRQFLAARAADPKNVLIAYECALRLIAYDREEWRADATEALQTAIDQPPRTEFEAAVQTRAVALRQAMREGREAERAFIKSQP
ncbi:MAG: hypothetical protein AAF936_18115 [Pseudomonadota bacterium]